jgi:hypothetical protein
VTIDDDGFWQQCKKIEHLVELVLKALQVFDRLIPAMAKA